MTDAEARGILLKHFYNRRAEPLVDIKVSDFGGMFTYSELQRIGAQLQEKNLITGWRTMFSAGDLAGFGTISAQGSDVVEGNIASPISIVFAHSDHSISVHSSPNAQIGNSNTQSTVINVDALIARIDSSNAGQVEKAEAKGLLKQFLAHPIIAAIVGGLASTL